MTNTRSKLAASAVLAAASLAAVACTSQAGHDASPAVGVDQIVTTPGQTPLATAAARQAAAPVDNWVSIPSEAASVPAGVLAPGAEISRIKENGRMGSCTIGPSLRGNAVLIAGHCGPAGTPRVVPDGTRVGVTEKSVNEIPAIGPVTDAAVVQLDSPLSPNAVEVAGLPVAGVMTSRGVKDLPAGTPVCFSGITSGVKCAPLYAATSEGIEVDTLSRPGDSGGPVFLVDGDTGAATLIGIASGHSTDGSNLFLVTYLDPTLERFDAEVLVDPTAAAEVAGDPRYSDRVSPLR